MKKMTLVKYFFEGKNKMTNLMRSGWLKIMLNSFLLGLVLLIGLQMPVVYADEPTPLERVQQIKLQAPATQIGQSATLLPDGNWLLMGGIDDDNQVSNQIELIDSTTKATLSLSAQLTTARAGHTATVLPDGSVLVIGGLDAYNNPLSSVERFYPETQTIKLMKSLVMAPRSLHTATLMMDGKLLITGGINAKNQVLASALWVDTSTWAVSKVIHKLNEPRYDHNAALLPGNSTLLAGGFDSNENPLSSGEVFDPDSQQFVDALFVDPSVLPQTPSAVISPSVQAVLPETDSQSIDINTRFSLRFSKPILPVTINRHSITLLGSAGPVDATVVAAEGGILAFITPKQQLLPDSQYTLFVDGVQDNEYRTVPFAAYNFHTQSLVPSASKAATSDSDITDRWIPSTSNYNGNWVSGNAYKKMSTQPNLEALLQSGKTLPSLDGKPALAGRVLTLDGSPLKHATLSVGDHQTQTDNNGEFLLNSLPLDSHVLVIDGGSASHGKHVYGRYEYHLVLKDKIINVLPFTIWMSALDTQHEAGINSPTTDETVITNPAIPGLELHIPAGTVIRDSQGNIVTNITITAIPVDQPPFPLPPGVPVPVYFTIQPGGAHLQSLSASAPQGAQLVYPNFSHAAPRSRIDFWNYDPVTKGWYIYGQGTVTEDGMQVMPDNGVAIYEFTGAMVSSPSNAPATAPPPGNAPPPNAPTEPSDKPKEGGDPVDSFSGLFTLHQTDLVVNDVLPLTVDRVYRPNDSASRAFGIGANLSYDIFLIGSFTDYSWADVILSDGARLYFQRTSAGTGYIDAVFTCTTTYTAPNAYTPASLCPSEYVGSTIRWAGNSTWVWQLKDGSRYYFPDSYANNNARYAAMTGYQDRFGNSLTLTRDGGRRLTRISGPGGRGINFTYDNSNRITQAADGSGNAVTYTYYTTNNTGQCIGCLATVTDALNKVKSYTYDSAARMLTVTDKRNNVSFTNVYNTTSTDAAFGRVVSQTLADASTYQFAYTFVNGKVTQTTETDERGIVNTTQFNELGMPLVLTQAVGTAEQQTTTYTRDTVTGLILTETDTLGRVTGYQYDSKGNTTQVTLLQGTASPQVWQYSYDPFYNQLLTVTDPLNHTTTMTRDTFGNVTSIADPLGNAIAYTYTGLGQLASMTLTANSVPMTTAYNYSGADLVSATDPLSHSTRFFHNAVGRVKSMADAANNQNGITYDALGRVTQTIDALGNTIQLAYDNNGNLTSYTDSRSHATNYTYDARNRVHTKTDQRTNVETYDYDAIGNLKLVTDRNGKHHKFCYDNLNRLKYAQYGTTDTTNDNNCTTPTVTYTWDAGDRMTDAVDASGTVHRVYDNLNRLTQEQGPTGTINYTYYTNNLRQSMTVVGQSAVNYTYDNANRLTDITQGSATVHITYDTANRRSTLTLPSGIVATYLYNNASELTSITYKKGTVTVGDLTYTYNSIGQRIAQGGSLLQVSLPGTVSASYDDANGLESWGFYTGAHDNNGNLTELVAGPWTNNLIHDERNRLIELNVNGSVNASYAYDALNRRIHKTMYNNSGVITTELNILYDGWQEVQELSGTTPTANLLTGPGLDEIYRRSTTASNTSNPSVTNDYLTDALHSTVALTDASGTIQTTYNYEPYGATTVYGTASDNPYQYTGRENDQNGLMYFRNRYLLTVGSFTQSDPIGFAGGQNTYLYVGGNPVMYTDPYGLLTQAAQQVVDGAMARNGGDVGAAALDIGRQRLDNPTDGALADAEHYIFTRDSNPIVGAAAAALEPGYQAVKAAADAAGILPDDTSKPSVSQGTSAAEGFVDGIKDKLKSPPSYEK